MKAQDVLADNMSARPVFLKAFRLLVPGKIRVIAKGGNIVCQSIQPYVNDVAVIKVDRNAPGKRGSGYAQILQTGFEEVVDHLVFPAFRLDKIRMGLNVVHQTLCIFLHIEEIGFFSGFVNRPAAVRAVAVLQLGFRPERFAGGTVPALVFAFVNIALLIKLFKNFLHRFFMLLIRGADKVVIRCVHQIPVVLNPFGGFIDKLFGRNAGGCRFFLNFLAVFIRASLEKDVVALGPFKTRQRVAENNFICVADMRSA